MLELEKAWSWREERGLIEELGSLRVFNGSGEGEGAGALSHIAIDRFVERDSSKAHFWVTEWEGAKGETPSALADSIARFLAQKGASSVVALLRPGKGVPAEPRVILGQPPEGKFIAREGKTFFLIRLLGAKHPGLFLDHYPLREWLRARARGLTVLNTFSYTGSLSVASGLGGAAHVTTLDLSSPTIAWAEENWKAHGLPSESARFISGDYFEWLPRLRREGKRFDLVLLDPPSFSRGKAPGSTFSTSKDLRKLHSLAFGVLKPDSFLVTSINSANVSWADYGNDVMTAARDAGVELQILSRIDLPDTFPTSMGREAQRYLKGWILRISSGSGASNTR
ncbi:MAG: class I SAM-dependent methyltransferase [Oligoflexia bacterium]|nr:class I SAM-dependent methyltransferase [Oligoflexia bacterium]